MMQTHRYQSGFTLIEVMVVVVIISVLVSFAVLSLGDGGKRDRLREEGKRLAALIELASQQAVLEGREWGMRISEDGYQFMMLDGDKWVEVVDDNLFRRRQLTPGFTLELRMEELDVSLTPPADEQTDATEKEAVTPQLFLMSSAERTPFEILIKAPGGEPSMTLETPPFGEVALYEGAHP